MAPTRLVLYPALVALAVGFGANTLAANTVPPLALDNLGPLALVWHERAAWVFVLALFLLWVVSWRLLAKGWATSKMLVLVGVVSGALYANALSIVWWGAAPDYLVFRRIDLIANVPDLLLLGGWLAMGALLIRRRLTR